MHFAHPFQSTQARMTHIETERLILRQFTEKDAGALFSLLSDKEVNTFLPMFPLRDIKEAEA